MAWARRCTATIALVILLTPGGCVTITTGTKVEGSPGTVAVSTAIVVGLKQLREAFEARRKTLLARGGGTAYPAPGVENLLRNTEKKLHKQFKEKEYAGLRAKTAEIFAEARQGIRELAQSADQRPRPVVELAALHLVALPPPGDGLPRRETDSFLDRVLGLLDQLITWSEQGEMQVTLCGISTPEAGAKIEFHARGDRVKVLKTQQELQIYRGKYQVRVLRPVRFQQEVDLWDFDQPDLECDLTARDCVPRERAGDCPR